MISIPGFWIFASLIGAVGFSMQVRWSLTKTETPGAKSRGIMRAALVELVGIGLLVLSARERILVDGLLIVVGLGMFIGVIAARALRPPP